MHELKEIVWKDDLWVQPNLEGFSVWETGNLMLAHTVQQMFIQDYIFEFLENSTPE